MVEATNFVKTMEDHQHRKIACLEEIAYLNGWISKNEWAEQNLGYFNSNQHITTDENSENPTDPRNSKWNW